MAVMITGASGFVGLNVAEALLTRGEHVVAVSRDTLPKAAIAVLAALPGRLTEATLDVRDTMAVFHLMRAHAVDRLFPLAAVTSGPAREADEPEEVIDVNLLGFIAQLRAARDAGISRVVVPASGAVYGESFHSHALLNEATTPCVPVGIYGVTKYAVERTALRLGRLWDMDVVVARIGSLFGPWEHDTGLRDLLTPHWALARAAVGRIPAVLPAVLPDYAWIYARDAARGLLHLLDLPNPSQRVFNLCSGRNWGNVITLWADQLAHDYPGFIWHQSDDVAAVTIPLSETLPRGRMDIARIEATGWAPAFTPAEAYADYAGWLTLHQAAL